MHKVMLSAAPVPASPHRIDPAALAEDVRQCCREGAAMVHLHVRDENAALTSDLTFLAETVRRIREKCDIIIEVSTGGVSDLTIRERCAPCFPDYVEANSLNVGSVNLGKAVYRNPADEVEYCAARILENRKLPETEVFELGMIHTLRRLTEQLPFRDPLLVALVFGHGGELPATPAALHHMLQFLDESFGSHVCDRAPALAYLGDHIERPAEGRELLWGYTQAGRRDWDMMRYALEQGADSLRVGFEDSDYLEPGRRAAVNAPLIRRAAQLVREAGCEPMTSDEARRLFRINEAGR
ncbi:3-keto-5-aminohexanoate cleavage protein [Lachnoclostridium sp. Marseille-P6806]|uniref:3-keto-5-aminohexanoate cleavage protein n=1 Tax=Lachnoclostridium sp. Marseille-P6806 TaxID=2364793 RepID=UPI00102F9A17|nr:3-keto-5-aminohexanoate cleavage protein [Lachnoclostridium sp. Marseille-P6806]